ncbi:MAG: hypothetical protein K2I96_13375 [Lachnospiraceae bacterium]|nr:hypothetical protein [Lachnospiraceae bacterium]
MLFWNDRKNTSQTKWLLYELQKAYYVPDTANVWEENIRNAMEDRRLMIPLEVRPGNEVEVPPNPYPFVMLPVLDYAEGEGIRDFYHEYGVQADPRLMISIIGAEGTGSFNTDIVNKAADGQNGPKEIFAVDLDDEYVIKAKK